MQIASDQRYGGEQSCGVENVAVEIANDSRHKPTHNEHVLAQMRPITVCKWLRESRILLLAGDMDELLPEW